MSWGNFLESTEKPKPKTTKKTCNYRKEKCPLDNNCLTNNIIYRATIKTNNRIKFYIGSTSTTFKNRYNNHEASFNNKLKQHNTELSYYIWELKEANKNYNLKWEILCRTKTKPKNNKTHRLCSLENYEIEKIKKELSLIKEKKDSKPVSTTKTCILKEQKQ